MTPLIIPRTTHQKMAAASLWTSWVVSGKWNRPPSCSVKMADATMPPATAAAAAVGMT